MDPVRGICCVGVGGALCCIRADIPESVTVRSSHCLGEVIWLGAYELCFIESSCLTALLKISVLCVSSRNNATMYR
jgi:hypothetical protein